MDHAHKRVHIDRPHAESQEERDMVALCTIDYWGAGDFKSFLETYGPETGDPAYWTIEDVTPQEFVNKWGEFIEGAADILDELVGLVLFREEWTR